LIADDAACSIEPAISQPSLHTAIAHRSRRDGQSRLPFYDDIIIRLSANTSVSAQSPHPGMGVAEPFE
jgi:hypothetical protein